MTKVALIIGAGDATGGAKLQLLARGVFGAPTFFVGGSMYWGQDRLDFVKQALKAKP